MAHRARGDCFAELDDALLDRRRFEGVERVRGRLGDTVEVVAVALDELDDDRLLRVEVVVQAARQDPGRIRDLSERCAQARRCEEGGGRLEDLVPARPIGHHRTKQ